MNRAWIVPLLAAALGCPVGTHAGKFEPAKSGAGISLVIETTAKGPPVELLAVEDTAVLVVAAGRVTLVPYRVVRKASVHQRGHLSFGRGGPTPEQRKELVLLARYPQGVSPELLQRLLEAYRQPELAVLER